MTKSPDVDEPPLELADALDRVDQAKENLVSLREELNKFLNSYVRSMLGGWAAADRFVLLVRHPSERILTGRQRVLTAQILEHLRTALDYMVFQLSVLNTPDLTEHVPQFIIADDESQFHAQAKRRLRYLTDEQRSLVERLQPYHGNELLGLLATLTGQGKHRYLPLLLDSTSLDIGFGELAQQDSHQDCLMYPVGNGSAVFVKPQDTPMFLLADKYDALAYLNAISAHVEGILRASYCFFQGRPLRLNIVWR